MTQTHYERLQENLSYLKLKKMCLKLGETIDFITKNELSFTEGLIKLTDYEIDHKEASMINAMVKTGGFPHRKEIDTFDFSFQENINKEQILEFLNHRFIHENQNIVFLGSSGVGKTHLATSIGISVAKKRMQTYYIKCHDLIENLRRAQLENRLADRIKHYSKYRLLIIDEIGYLPIEKEDSKLFFQLIDRRYEKKSTIFTTNINFSEWGNTFRDPIIANAILDRVLHHAHVIQITGKSYRLKDYFNESEE